MACCAGCEEGSGCSDAATFRPLFSNAHGSIDPATGLDLEIGRALEEALRVESALVSQGQDRARARQQAVASLGCPPADVPACAEVYGLYRDARIRFELAADALSVSLAQGPLTGQEVAIVVRGPEGQREVEPYSQIRTLFDVITDDLCDASRSGCVRDFGGVNVLLAALLAAIAEIIAAEPDLALMAPFFPAPAEPEQLDDFIDVDVADDTHPPAPTPPPDKGRTVLLDVGKLKRGIVDAFLGMSRKQPGQGTPSDNSLSPAPPSNDPPPRQTPPPEPAPPRPPTQDRGPGLPPGQRFELMKGLPMMGAPEDLDGLAGVGDGDNQKEWAGRSIMAMEVSVGEWHALEAGYGLMQAQGRRANFSAEPTSGVTSRTNSQILASALRAARAARNLLPSDAQSPSSPMVLKYMEGYFLARVRFERFASAWRFARERQLLPARPGEVEVNIATGRTNPSKTSTCTGRRVTPLSGRDFFIADSLNCSYIATIEAALYRNWRSHVGLRSNLEAPHIGLHLPSHTIPPPPAMSQVALQTRALAMSRALSVPIMEPLSMPAAALAQLKQAVGLGPKVPPHIPRLDFLDPPAPMVMFASAALPDQSDELLAQQLSDLRVEAAELAAACVRGDMKACKRAGELTAKAASLASRLAASGDAGGVLKRSDEILDGGDEGDEDKGVFERLAEWLQSINPFMKGSEAREWIAAFRARIKDTAGTLGLSAVVATVFVALVALGFMALAAWLAAQALPHGAATAKELFGFQARALDKAPEIIGSVLPIKSALAGVMG